MDVESWLKNMLSLEEDKLGKNELWMWNHDYKTCFH